MNYVAFGKKLPKALSVPLFGDRERFGYTPDVKDASWKTWRQLDLEFYDQNQRRSVGGIVNGMGYRIMRQIKLHGLKVLEVGPGALDHVEFWQDSPEMFYAADIRPELLARAEQRLRVRRVAVQSILIDVNRPVLLPLPDASIDAVLSFYSLEHLYPLPDHLREIIRVLKPSGRLIGAIPCEGGVAWGLGRFLTTRRWLKAHGCTEPDKIISWEHPNFADGILNELHRQMRSELVSFWPMGVPIIDVNLVARFIFRKC